MKKNTFLLLSLAFLLAACRQEASPTPKSTLEINPPPTNLPTDTLTLTPTTRLENWQWFQSQADEYPAPWWSAPAVYDPDRQVIVIFGGRTPDNIPLSETWEFDGNSWNRVDTLHSPPARIWHAMAYDLTRKVMVLFGGDDSTSSTSYLNDTWEFDGQDWKQVQPAIAPAPRGHGPSMVYDSCRQNMVLFGGEGTDGNATWEYDGTTWSAAQESSSSNLPASRWLSAMVFDPFRCKTILFGGGGGPDGFNDTWEYDGETWALINPSVHPDARWAHAMTFDPISSTVFLFGGYVPGISRGANDTWSYDGQTWSQVPIQDAPSDKGEPIMVYHPISGRLLLLDGNAVWYLGLHPAMAAPATPQPTGSTPLATPGLPIASSTPECGAGWTRLEVNAYAIVTPGDLPNRVRKEPLATDPNNIIYTLYPGEIVKILAGPICSDGLVFWMVGNGDIPGGSGWTAEGDGKIYYLEPYQP